LKGFALLSGLVFTIVGLGALGLEVYFWFDDGHYAVRSFGHLWNLACPDSLVAAKSLMMEGRIGDVAPWLWDPLITFLLRVPASASLLPGLFLLYRFNRQRGAKRIFGPKK